MTTPQFLARVEINGKDVSFFSPPHPEPDFPWVDVEQLAGVFLDRAGAQRMTRHAHEFDRQHRPVTTARNGDRIATIVPHALAQGLCSAIDEIQGFIAKDEDEDGPAFSAYCRAAGIVAANHWPLSFDQIVHAFKNPGGPFLSRQ